MIPVSVLAFYPVRTPTFLLKILAKLGLIFDRYALILRGLLDFWSPASLLDLELVVCGTLELKFGIFWSVLCHLLALFEYYNLIRGISIIYTYCCSS